MLPRWTAPGVMVSGATVPRSMVRVSRSAPRSIGPRSMSVRPAALAVKATSPGRSLPGADVPDCPGGSHSAPTNAVDSVRRCATGSGRSAGAAIGAGATGPPATSSDEGDASSGGSDSGSPPRCSARGLAVLGLRLGCRGRLRTGLRRGLRGRSRVRTRGLRLPWDVDDGLARSALVDTARHGRQRREGRPRHAQGDGRVGPGGVGCRRQRGTETEPHGRRAGCGLPDMPLTPDDSAATSGSATEDAVRWMTVSPGWCGTPGGSGSTSRSLLSGASPGSDAAAPRRSGLPARAPSAGTSGPVSTGSWPAVAAPSSESEAVAARSSEGPSEGGVRPTPAGEGLPASGIRCSAAAAAATLLGGASAAAGVGVRAESESESATARRHATTSRPRGPGSASPRRRIAGPAASTVASRLCCRGFRRNSVAFAAIGGHVSRCPILRGCGLRGRLGGGRFDRGQPLPDVLAVVTVSTGFCVSTVFSVFTAGRVQCALRNRRRGVGRCGELGRQRLRRELDHRQARARGLREDARRFGCCSGSERGGIPLRGEVGGCTRHGWPSAATLGDRQCRCRRGWGD